MHNKLSFWTLCNKYDKIEVPIIQRDYAQGRKSASRIRNKFSEYLIDNLIKNNQIELDFVYGSVIEHTDKENKKQSVFIPLDGQQRLTTLFLLHWFIALREKRVDEIKDVLSKFNYETRPSSHSFCNAILKHAEKISPGRVKHDIEDAIWFDDDWFNDPSVTGMITMLDTFSHNTQLSDYKDPLLDRLLDENQFAISFYFIPLEKFGLTENLYIRMNARGKILTDFENFKAEFYKIINGFPTLVEEVKDKMEYVWVENLWPYRIDKKGKDLYVTDRPFMIFLMFVTEMLYFRRAEFRSDKEYENDFTDFRVLNSIYSSLNENQAKEDGKDEREENVRFLIFALDFLKELQSSSAKVLWHEDAKSMESLADILGRLLKGENIDIVDRYLLYATLVYFFRGKSRENFDDYIRVIRNLIHNTNDKSQREWPRLLKSVERLISNVNVYDMLIDSEVDLTGFSLSQRHEEIAKAKILRRYPKSKPSLQAAEDCHALSGNITVLLAASMVRSGGEEDIKNFDIKKIAVGDFDQSIFDSIFRAYQTISEDYFNVIWGDLLPTTLYTQLAWTRLTYSHEYKKHPAVLHMAVEFNDSGKTLQEFLMDKEKYFVRNICSQYDDLSQVRNFKHQLYLYYIITTRVMEQQHGDFFKNGYNFGGLPEKTGFTSLFKAGISKDTFFKTTNPIFQTYDSQFRYNCGLKKSNALDIEIVGRKGMQKPFEHLIKWANS